ncbi:MAG TPA: aminotransferase class IV [Acidimicrobiia bacterium]|jgi:branched-subunit amino acid aminotransferase/4-amino-4-deoxychorismate lyase
MTTTVLINGVESEGTISVTDSAVLRGDGCFEVLKSRSGRVFGLNLHLDRLFRSAKICDITLPARSDIEDWVERVAAEGEDCAVRVVVTRGSALPGVEAVTQVVVFGHPWSREPGPTTLLPMVAPWHAAGVPWELAGAKLLSYAPNMAASRRAVAGGFGDALLTSIEDVMLEGPTFSVAWVIGGVVETPGLSLGILDSITRRVMLELADGLGIETREGEWTLDRLDLADEVMALSTIRDIQPVSAVGRRAFVEGAVTARLSREFAQLTR